MSIEIEKAHEDILECQGHALILGQPGSGKTTLALLKAVRRINEGMAPGQSALFLSFSRAAVVRISEAAENELRLTAEQQAMFSIQTFHSFFWKILRAHGYLLGAPAKLSLLLPHVEKEMNAGIQRNDPAWSSWEGVRNKLFHEDGQVCFDLFAPLTAEILGKGDRIARRIAHKHPLILVDEAQDTGDEQWACIKALALHTQVICLGDPDQMIFHHLPGVTAARLDGIRAALDPLEINLGARNRRSPGTEIAIFARDIFEGKIRGSSYKGVSRMHYHPKAESRDKAIRQSVALLYKRIKDETKTDAESIAIITAYTNGVADVSTALHMKAIRHQVLYDEAFALWAARVAMFLMEPKAEQTHSRDVATLLDLASSAFRTKGTKTALANASKWRGYAANVLSGKVPKVKIVAAAEGLVTFARARHWSGRAAEDWQAARDEMAKSNDPSFSGLAAELRYLMGFGRAERLTENLSRRWLERGNYADARTLLESAVAHEQILSTSGTSRGLSVMNTHKCKGKQFDGVVLYQERHSSPFEWYGEGPPHSNSRRLLHMAITRARKHVLLLVQAFPRCPITGPHQL